MSSISRALLCGASLLLTAASAPLAAQTAPPQRFAYVDTRDILNAAPGRAEAEAAYQKEALVWEAELKKLQDRANAMTSEFQKNSATMTATAKDKRQKEIQDTLALFQKRNDEINAEADRRRSEMLQPIRDQVMIALEDVRMALNVDAIFDVGQGATIVAVNKNLNVTDRVIARLRLLGPPAVGTKAAASSVPTPSKPAAPTKPASSGMPTSTPAGIGRPTPPARVDTNSTMKPDATPLSE
jgi:Skp family chaperone for outer membrane proteins